MSAQVKQKAPTMWRTDYGRVRAAVTHWLDTGSMHPSLGPGGGYGIHLSEWSGARTPEEARRILAGGFHMESSGAAHGDVFVRPRRRMRWADDGDLDVGQALVGADFPFARWDPRPKKPGLAIVAEICFHAGVSQSVVSAYGSWVAGEMRRLEGEGYDLDASVTMPLTELFTDHESPRYGKAPERFDVRVVLKRENEASDFRSWSPIFSPLGFRVLGFTAMHMAAHALGWRCTSYLGVPAPQGDDWGVLFNQDTRTMRILVPRNPRGDFPAERMTEQLLAALPERGA